MLVSETSRISADITFSEEVGLEGVTLGGRRASTGV